MYLLLSGSNNISAYLERHTPSVGNTYSSLVFIVWNPYKIVFSRNILVRSSQNLIFESFFNWYATKETLLSFWVLLIFLCKAHRRSSRNAMMAKENCAFTFGVDLDYVRESNNSCSCEQRFGSMHALNRNLNQCCFRYEKSKNIANCFIFFQRLASTHWFWPMRHGNHKTKLKAFNKKLQFSFL